MATSPRKPAKPKSEAVTRRARTGTLTAYYDLKDPKYPTVRVKRAKVVPSQQAKDHLLHDLWRKGELFGSPEPKMFADVVAHHLATLSDETIRGVLKIYIMPRFGHLRLVDVTADLIEQMYFEVAISRGPGTTRKLMQQMEALFNQAINLHSDEDYWMTPDENPMRQVVPELPALHRNAEARQRRARPLPLPTMSNLAHLVARAMGRMRTLFLLAIFAGLRGQEIRALHYEDVKLFDDHVELHIVRAVKKDSLKIGSVKSNAGRRYVTVGGLLFEHFKELLKTPRAPDELVVPADTGIHDVIPYGVFWAMVHDFQVSVGIGVKLGSQAYIGSFGIHMYRHAAAALWIWSNMEDTEIARMLGHNRGDLALALERYGYLFEAQMNNPTEWPETDPPMSMADKEDVLMELEDAEFERA